MDASREGKKGGQMLNLGDLKLGFNDAEDYRRRENKEMFNSIFVKDNNLEKLLQQNIFFLIGEKGTGKTAYSVFLANNEYKNTRSQLRYIRETEYQKFIELKKEKHLVLSDYVSIWKVILLVLIAKNIKKDDITHLFSKNARLEAINDALDEYYSRAFSPEISTVMQIVDNSSIAAELILKSFNAKISNGKSVAFSESRFQTNLLFIERYLFDALYDLKLNFNQYLFVDGIDIRPDGIPYEEYLLCVKGLAEAIWNLNNDYFPTINDSKGRIKIVMLIRPDIFDSLGLQNSTNKIRNNSVFLDWRTTYPEYRTSSLFALSDRLLSYQQENNDISPIGSVWDEYFPWTSQATSPDRENDTPFIQFLRLSYSRPRDIVTILLLLQEISKDKSATSFSKDVFCSNEFTNAYSEYLMGGIKDQLAFYYSKEDYELLLHFLSLFKGHAEFNYDYFKSAYIDFSQYVLEKANELPEFIDTDDMLLQFLYSANIICYIEPNQYGEPLFRWCYRERSISNLSPKVAYNKKYRFHYGLLKDLNLGSYSSCT